MRISIMGISARNSAISGMSKIAKQVKESIGSFGLNHLSEKENKISNDGVFIAASLCRTLPDEFERRGALVVEENVKKINDEVGDFSSTAWAFTEALVKEVVRFLPTETTIKSKKTHSEVAQMIETGKNEVLALLKEMAKPVESKEELIKSALVSSEDEKVAELLGGMQWDLGIEGRIIAEDSNDKVCSIEKVDGILLDNGFVSSNLVTNPETNTLEILSPLPIILTNYVIGEPEMKILRENIFKQLATQKKTGCILMARAFTKEAIQETQTNMKSFAVVLLNAPYTDQAEVMRDIQAVVGGRYIDSEEGRLEDIYITDVGSIKRIVARPWKAQISGINDEQYKERVAKRVELLKKKVIGSESDFEKRGINERIAQLTGGFAILKVGSKALDDRRRLKDKADDSVNTVRNALREGTVRGAGIALKEISDKISEDNILKRPLLCINNQIMSSAPEDYVVPEYVRDAYWSLKTVIDRVCAFVPTFVSINSIDCEEDKPECNCGNKIE